MGRGTGRESRRSWIFACGIPVKRACISVYFSESLEASKKRNDRLQSASMQSSMPSYGSYCGFIECSMSLFICRIVRQGA
jgi:hypothetical protein